MLRVAVITPQRGEGVVDQQMAVERSLRIPVLLIKIVKTRNAALLAPRHHVERLVVVRVWAYLAGRQIYSIGVRATTTRKCTA